jgi:hypothetical protein
MVGLPCSEHFHDLRLEQRMRLHLAQLGLLDDAVHDIRREVSAIFVYCR